MEIITPSHVQGIIGFFIENLEVHRWTHSVLHEVDFRSEWAAIEDAVELQCEVCCISADDWRRSDQLAAIPHVPATMRHVARVHYHDEVQVFVGSALELSMQSFAVPSERLSDWLLEVDDLIGDDSHGGPLEEPLSSVLSPRKCTLPDSVTTTSTKSPFELTLLNVSAETAIDAEIPQQPVDFLKAIMLTHLLGQPHIVFKMLEQALGFRTLTHFLRGGRCFVEFTMILLLLNILKKVPFFTC